MLNAHQFCIKISFPLGEYDETLYCVSTKFIVTVSNLTVIIEFDRDDSLPDYVVPPAG